MIKNFSEVIGHLSTSWRSLMNPKLDNKKEPIPGYILEKAQNNKDKESLLKAAREKRQLPSDKAQRQTQWKLKDHGTIFSKGWEENSWHSRTVNSKCLLKKGQRKIFSNTNSLTDCYQQTLDKGNSKRYIFYAEGNWSQMVDPRCKKKSSRKKVVNMWTKLNKHWFYK